MRILPLLPIALVGVLLSTTMANADTSETLSDEVRGKALYILRTALHSEKLDEFWVAMHAAEGLTLAGYGPEVIPSLRERLTTDQDSQHRCGIARELVRAGARGYVSVLTEILMSPDPHGHIHAAESLFKVSELGDADTMLRYFQNEKGDIKLRLMAAAALARKGDADALRFIRDARDGSEVTGYQIAAWILGVLGDETDIPPLHKRITDAPSPIVRAYVENALAALGDADGLARLARNLEDDDPGVRAYAATFASDAKATSLRPQLEHLLNDSDPDTRVRAAQSLLFLFPSNP